MKILNLFKPKKPVFIQAHVYDGYEFDENYKQTNNYLTCADRINKIQEEENCVFIHVISSSYSQGTDRATVLFKKL